MHFNWSRNTDNGFVISKRMVRKPYAREPSTRIKYCDADKAFTIKVLEEKKFLFDFLKNRKYNYNKRVASKRKSSLLAARFFVKN